MSPSMTMRTCPAAGAALRSARAARRCFLIAVSESARFFVATSRDMKGDYAFSTGVSRGAPTVRERRYGPVWQAFVCFRLTNGFRTEARVGCGSFLPGARSSAVIKPGNGDGPNKRVFDQVNVRTHAQGKQVQVRMHLTRYGTRPRAMVKYLRRPLELGSLWREVVLRLAHVSQPRKRSSYSQTIRPARNKRDAMSRAPRDCDLSV